MSLATSREAYEDCYQAMDMALEAKDGVRVGFETKEEAKYYRMRMNQARFLDRKFNNGRYTDIKDPRRYKSEYDALVFRLREVHDKFYIYIEAKPKFGVVEEIKDEKIDVIAKVHRRA
jgi:hypothetical protein